MKVDPRRAEKQKLIKAELKRINRPIYKAMRWPMLLIAVNVAILFLKSKMGWGASKWSDLPFILLLIVGLLWLKGLSENLKSTIAFEDDLPLDTKLDKWIERLSIYPFFILFFGIAVLRFFTHNLSPQWALWLYTVIAGLLFGYGVLWLLMRRYPWLDHSSEKRQGELTMMWASFSLLSVIILQMGLIRAGQTMDATTATYLLKEDKGSFLWVNEKWLQVRPPRAISRAAETGDSLRVDEVDLLGIWTYYRDFEVVE